MKQPAVLPILFITLLLDMIGTGMIFPIIPIIFTDPSSGSFLLHGYTQAEQFFIAGLVTALFGLMQFIAAPILGELSDVFGRKKLLMLGVGVLAVSQFLFGFGIAVKSLALLLISRSIAGLAAANFSIAQASIADITKPEDRAKNFGLIGGAFGIGFIIGPLLSGWLAHFTGSAASPFWFAGFLGIINFIICYFFLPETHKNLAQAHNFHFLKGIQNLRAAFQDKEAKPLYMSSFLYMSGFTFIVSFSGVLLVQQFGFSAGQVGTFYGVVGIFIVITQLFLLRIISNKYDERTILRVTLLILVCSVGMYPFITSSTWVYAIIPFLAIPQGLSIANMGALISKNVSPQKQGAALGINGSLLAFSQGIIPLVAGVGSGAVGLKAPFLAGSFLILIAWCILFVKFK